MTTHKKKMSFFEKNPLILNTPGPTSPSPGLQDDRALQYFLLRDSSKLAFRNMYLLARQTIITAEGPKADIKTVVANVAQAVAQVTDGILTYDNTRKRTALSTPNETAPSGIEADELNDRLAPLHIWSAISDVYRTLRQEPVPGGGKQDGMDYPYFARDVLLSCFIENRAATVEVLSLAYRQPAYVLLQKKGNLVAVDFADAYQEAVVSLLKTTFQPDKKHTAQLFTFFFTILLRRCQDQLRTKGRRERIDNDYHEIIAPDRHIPAAYDDYMIDKLNLHEFFGQEELGGILTKALDGIGDDCKRLLRLIFYRGYSYQQTAEIMKIKANGIGKRRERCLKKLGDHLSPDQTTQP